jgi:hypothetical protein
MNKEDFIKAIKIAVCNSVPDDIDAQLQDPLPEMKDLAEWYGKLNSEEKRMLKRVIQLSVDNSIFGFLCVLDGVRAIEDTIEKGNLELTYSKYGHKVLLNEERGMYLHDIFNG